MDKIGDIDDKTWRKMELLRLSYDIVKGGQEFDHISDNENRLEYLEQFSLKIIEKKKNRGVMMANPDYELTVGDIKRKLRHFPLETEVTFGSSTSISYRRFF